MKWKIDLQKFPRKQHPEKDVKGKKEVKRQGSKSKKLQYNHSPERRETMGEWPDLKVFFLEFMKDMNVKTTVTKQDEEKLNPNLHTLKVTCQRQAIDFKSIKK